MSITLRPYQTTDLESLREGIRSGHRSNLLVEPTGAGKGTTITFIITESVKRGNTVMFLVNRRSLVVDMSRRVDALGIDHGVIMAGHPRNRPYLPVQIASTQTLQNRRQLPKADIIILDEAHFCVSPGYHEIIKLYPDAFVIGMTATPCRLDGKGLGQVFENMVLGPSDAELESLGYLCPATTYAPPLHVDVRKSNGDYNQEDLAKFMMYARKHLTGDIIDHWKRLGRGRPTVVFAVNRTHSESICEEMRAAGIRAVTADGETSLDERDRIWERLERGDTEVVCTVGIVSYGFNLPCLSCIIQARPTQSISLHRQQLGRGRRVHPGKDRLIILDHAGNSHAHGQMNDVIEWSLTDGFVKNVTKEKAKEGVRYCKTCFIAFSSRESICPSGHPYHTDNSPKVIDGSLEALKEPDRLFICLNCKHRGRIPSGVRYEDYGCPKCEAGAVKAIMSWYDTGEDKRTVFEKLVAEGQERGYKEGWARLQYHIRYKQWPKWEWRGERRHTHA